MTTSLNKSKPKLGILISGRGSNMQAIATAINNKALHASITVVVANTAKAVGIEIAQGMGLTTTVITRKQFATQNDFESAMLAALQNAGVDCVILAGYNRILGQMILNAYPNRILNIHPSLLPKYGGKGMVGMAVHEAVLDAGEAESGCTVHLVNAVIDGGEILAQHRVPVLEGDTSLALAKRVLQAEHMLYPAVIADYCKML
ncbi:MAG: phosphoribosylglycinamide formyltransferase [Cyanobacteria bacterium P01_H01_bin.74]